MSDSGDITFSAGQKVRLITTGATGEIVSGPDKKGFFVVAIGGITLRTKAEHLTAVTVKTKKRRAKAPASIPQPESAKAYRLDLHGFRKAEAVQALEDLLDKALRENGSRLEIIHGLGTGAVREAVHAYLACSRHVRSFHVDVSNPGTTWAIL